MEYPTQCQDCLAYYTGAHVCPPWLKSLVARNKQKANGESRHCHKHDLDVFPFYSRNKDKYYWKHEFTDPKTGKQITCWVNSEEEIEGFREKQVDYANDQRGAV